MTVLLASAMLSLQAQGVSVCSVVVPQSHAVAIQVVIQFPEVSERSFAAANVLKACLLEETEDYSGGQIVSWGSQTGRPPEVIAQPDRLMIRLEFPEDQGKNAIYLMDSILRRSILKSDSIRKSLTSPVPEPSSGWLLAENPWKANLKALQERDVRDFWSQVCRPENVTFCVGGRQPGDLLPTARDRFADWKPAPIRRTVAPQIKPLMPLLQTTHPLNYIVFEGPLMPIARESASAAMLSGFALGVGKGSTHFRVVREDLGQSYIVYGGIWPEKGGFRYRAFSWHAGQWNQEKAEAIRSGLQKDVEGWNQQTLDRAAGIAEGTLLHQVGPWPIVLGLGDEAKRDVSTLTLSAAVWRSSTGREWDAAEWVRQMRTVTLAELRAEAAKIVSDGSLRVILGAAGPEAKPVP